MRSPCTNTTHRQRAGSCLGLLLSLQLLLQLLALPSAAFSSGRSIGFWPRPNTITYSDRQRRRRRRQLSIAFVVEEDPQQTTAIGSSADGKDRSIVRMHYRRPRSIALVPLEEEEDDEPVVDQAEIKDLQQTNNNMERVVVVATTPAPQKHHNVVEEAPATRADMNLAENTIVGDDSAIVLDNDDIEISDDVVAVQDNLTLEPVAAPEKEDKEVITTIQEEDPSWNTTETMSVSGEAVKMLATEFYFVKKQKPRKLDETELENILDNFCVKKDATTPATTLEETEEDVNLKQDEVIAETELPVEAKRDALSLSREFCEEKTETLTPPVPPDKAPSLSLFSENELNADVVCAQAFASVQQHPILLFDGACNLCNGWVNFCLDFDVKASFRFASLQSKVGQAILIRDGRPPDDRSDIILATPQETFAKSDAVLRVISQLEGLPVLVRFAATLTRLILPTWFRNAVYKFASVNRHIFGEADGPQCRLDLDGEYIGRFIEDPQLDEYDENLASESEEEVFVKRR